MGPRSVLLAILAGAVGAASAPTAERWVRVRSPHAEVLSDAGEESARGAARRLERLHEVLPLLLPAAGEEDEGRVSVLAFGDAHAFEGFVPPEGGEVEGFFQGGTDRVYVALHLPSPTPGEGLSWATLDHEYAHVQLNRSLPAQPLWVSEGLAEVLSGGDLDGAEARLGAARPDRVAVLRRGPRVPLAELLAAAADSPLLADASRRDVFYAESEALVRLVVARYTLDGLLDFLAAVSEGRDPVDAFSRRFGDLATIEAHLLDVSPGPLFSLAAPGESEGRPLLAAEIPAEAEVDSLLGDLLLHEGRLADARRLFERAVAADPACAPAHAGLAELLRRKGRWAKARAELRLALAARPDEPAALVRHARLLLDEAKARGGAPSPAAEAEAVASLEKALARAPDLAEAAEMLARLAPEPLSRRIAVLRRAFVLDPGRPDLAVVLASLYAKRHDLVAARGILRRGREAARDPAYRFLCDHLLSQVEGWVAVTGEAVGRLVAVDCRGDGSLRFTLAVSRGTLALEAPSARSFFVDGPDDLRELELVCGRQDLPVRVRYLPGLDPAGGGTLLTLRVLAPGLP
jgi:tetratricopeptide (TPR) repeat protein